MLKQILMRLFNSSPSSAWSYILDNEGTRFWVYWESFERTLYLHVIYKGHPVGIATLLWNDTGFLELTAIDICERYRHRGFGRAVMQEVISKAKEKNALGIVGVITPIGGRVTVEYLTDWYKRQGFTVRERQIYLRLS